MWIKRIKKLWAYLLKIHRFEVKCVALEHEVGDNPNFNRRRKHGDRWCKSEHSYFKLKESKL